MYVKMVIRPMYKNNLYIYIYIIAKAERKWIPTFKEVLTNRKKDPP